LCKNIFANKIILVFLTINYKDINVIKH